MKHSTLRALVFIVALALALSLLGVPGAVRKVNSQFKTIQATGAGAFSGEDIDADKALALLKLGNERWQTKMEERNWSEERAQTADDQHPFAVVVACMDSRVPPELIFDRGLGEIFVIRVAGPVLNKDELASLEYALVKKHVKLVVVLGHTNCGAVKGAVDREQGKYLPELLYKIEPAIKYVSDKYNGGRRITSADKKDLNRVSIANARLVHSQILTRRALREPGVQVKWGLYYVNSGKVAFEPRDVEQ